MSHTCQMGAATLLNLYLSFFTCGSFAPTRNKRLICSFAKISQTTNLFTSGPSITRAHFFSAWLPFSYRLDIVQSLDTSWENNLGIHMFARKSGHCENMFYIYIYSAGLKLRMPRKSSHLSRKAWNAYARKKHGVDLYRMG